VVLISLASAISITSTDVWCKAVGGQYILHRPGKTIAGHPGPGMHAVSIRLQHGSVARVLAIDQQTGWYQVQVEDDTAWIVKKYFGDELEPVTPETVLPSYRIATCNLEWLRDGKSRGFPENTYGGPTIPPRTDEDYAAIAEVISHELEAAVLVLTEINAFTYAREEGEWIESPELDRLLSHLGENYDYEITESGGQQHVAVLYDENKVRLNTVFEIDVPYERVQNKDVFARDPLVSHFTFLAQGVKHGLNDFVIVGLHLASGQGNNSNHDRAMEILLDNLDFLLEEGEELPVGKTDIVITGDLNLSIFDSKRERVLEQMESGQYDILADDGYPATRLAGVPLAPKSQIDYIIVTDDMRGQDREVDTSQATVRQNLASQDYAGFRQVFSDHFPVTAEAKLLEDDD
jgi:endonuclease/exonuclease/phosphatase family metal-dependent hydrolase